MSAIALPASRIERLSTTRAVLWISVTIALLVHMPIYPAIWDIVEQLISHKKDETEQTETEVPLDLDLGNDSVDVKQQETPPPPKPETAPIGTGEEPRDAEPPKPPPDAEDAGVPPDAPDAMPPDAETPDAAPPDAGPPPIASTEAPLDKTPTQQIDAPPNPSGNVNNVEIVLVGKQLRSHPVGEKMGKLLPNIRQWQGFFAGGSVDAVKDVDLISLTGPQMRKSDQLDAILVWNTPMDKVKGALDALVKRSNGSWLEGAPTPTALAKADNADRMFVMIEDKHLLYITPPPHEKKGEKEWTPEKRADEEKKKIDKILKFKPPKVDLPFAILISVKEPGRLSRFVVDTGILGEREIQMVPTTVEKFVFRVDPLPEGAALARIELWDDSPQDAVADLADVQAHWALARLASSAKLHVELPEATFTTKGRVISAEANVTREFLDSTFDLGVVLMNEDNRHK